MIILEILVTTLVASSYILPLQDGGEWNSDFCAKYYNIFSTGLVLSEFESHMTGEKGKKWNLNFAKVGFTFTFATIFFIIICQVIIKGFYRSNKSTVKQRYKSMVSFKILRVTLGLFIIISSYAGIIFMPGSENYRGLATPFPFILTLVGNIILLVFLTTNEDAGNIWWSRLELLITEDSLRWTGENCKENQESAKSFLTHWHTSVPRERPS